MKKYSWLAAIIVVFALVFAFAGCGGAGAGGGRGPGTPGTPPVVGAVVEITFNAGDGVFPNGLGIARRNTGADGRITPPADVTLAGYKLAEWNTSSEGTGTTLTANTVHNAETSYYAIWEQDEFDITGSWDFGAPIVFAPGVNAWHIEGEAITAMKAAVPGSIIRLSMDATGGRGGDRNNWGIGSIGTGTTELDADVIGLRTAAGAGLVYTVYAEVTWLVEILGAGTRLTLFVPINNGDMLKKIDLMEPKAARPVGERPCVPEQPQTLAPGPVGGTLVENRALTITYGFFGDRTIGKGDILGPDLQLIKDTIAGLGAGEAVTLRVYVHNNFNANRTSWDVGQINGQGVLFGAGPNSDRFNDISQTALEVLLARDSAKLELNPYNEHSINRVELWKHPRPFINVTVDGSSVTDIFVNGSRGDVTHRLDNTGYRFAGTGGGHRGKYAWFRLDFGSERLSNFARIEFDLYVHDSLASRRFGLMAQTTAFSGSLANHQTTDNSGAGFLARYQVTEAMTTSVEGAGDKGTISLNILPTYANTLNATGILFLSIYEHTAETADIEITNIRFVK